MANYNGFDINESTTPAPWGLREEQAWKDSIDTLVGDTVKGEKDSAGHKHDSLYDAAQSKIINATTIGSVSKITIRNLSQSVPSSLSIYNGATETLKLDSNASELRGISGLNIKTTANNIIIKSGGTGSVSLNTTSGGIQIDCQSDMDINTTSGNIVQQASRRSIFLVARSENECVSINGNVIVTQNDVKMPNLPTSSAGLAVGTIYRMGSSNNLGIV